VGKDHEDHAQAEGMQVPRLWYRLQLVFFFDFHGGKVQGMSEVARSEQKLASSASFGPEH